MGGGRLRHGRICSTGPDGPAQAGARRPRRGCPALHRRRDHRNAPAAGRRTRDGGGPRGGTRPRAGAGSHGPGRPRAGRPRVQRAGDGRRARAGHRGSPRPLAVDPVSARDVPPTAGGAPSSREAGTSAGRTPVTVVIAAKNEEAHIGGCVASVAGWAAEVLVVEHGSTDDTVLLTRAEGATVFSHPFETIGKQRN